MTAEWSRSAAYLGGMPSGVKPDGIQPAEWLRRVGEAVIPTNVDD
jgi:hypothetical protein